MSGVAVDDAGSDAVMESSGLVVRYFDALTGWARRVWIASTAAAVVVGLLVAAAGHLVAGLAWVDLALFAWGARSVLATQRTEIGPSWVAVRGAFGARAVEAREVRAVVVVHSDLAAPRLVVRGRGASQIEAQDIDALEPFVLAHRRREHRPPAANQPPAPSQAQPPSQQEQGEGQWGALPPQAVAVGERREPPAWPKKP